MHNIKYIRQNLDEFKIKIRDRNTQINFDELISLDEENRKLIQEKENFEKEKKIISKSKDKTMFEKSKKISNNINELSDKQKIIKSKLDNILSTMMKKKGYIVARRTIAKYREQLEIPVARLRKEL